MQKIFWILGALVACQIHAAPSLPPDALREKVAKIDSTLNSLAFMRPSNTSLPKLNEILKFAGQATIDPEAFRTLSAEQQTALTASQLHNAKEALNNARQTLADSWNSEG